MPLTKHSPPAFVNDLPEALAIKWSKEIENWFQRAIRRIKKDHHVNEPYLFSLLEHPEAENGLGKEIPWQGFPRKFMLTII